MPNCPPSLPCPTHLSSPRRTLSLLRHTSHLSDVPLLPVRKKLQHRRSGHQLVVHLCRVRSPLTAPSEVRSAAILRSHSPCPTQALSLVSHTPSHPASQCPPSTSYPVLYPTMYPTSYPVCLVTCLVSRCVSCWRIPPRHFLLRACPCIQ